eukprot:scaffold4495_cov79-Skeletonema_marinoi.AAC.3
MALTLGGLIFCVTSHLLFRRSTMHSMRMQTCSDDNATESKTSSQKRRPSSRCTGLALGRV